MRRPQWLEWFLVNAIIYTPPGWIYLLWLWKKGAERRAKRAVFRKMGLECLLGSPPQVVEPKNPPFCVAHDEARAKISNG